MQGRHAIRLVLPELRPAVRDARDRLACHQQVAALLGQDGGRGGRPMADEQRADAGERLLGAVERAQPGVGVPVCQVGVRAVEGQVAHERDVAVAEQPDGLALALAGSEVPGGEAQVAEHQRLLVRDGAVGNVALDGHSSPNIGPHCARLASSWARISRSTSRCAITGTSSPASSSVIVL